MVADDRETISTGKRQGQAAARPDPRWLQRGLTHDFGDAMAAKRNVAQQPKRRKSKADAVALDRTPFILMASGSLRL